MFSGLQGSLIRMIRLSRLANHIYGRPETVGQVGNLQRVDNPLSAVSQRPAKRRFTIGGRIPSCPAGAALRCAVLAAVLPVLASAQPGAFIGPVRSTQVQLAGLAQLADGTLLYADAYGVYRVKGSQVETLLTNPVQGGECIGSFPGVGCIEWAPLVYHTKPMAADSNGAIYIADPEQHLLERYDETQQAFATIASNVGAPTSLAAWSDGSLYFNDPAGCRVLRWNQNAVTTVAGTGTCGYSNDGGPATGAEILAVTAIALDGGGNLYIADAKAGVVRRVDTNGIILTIVGTGNPGIGGEATPAGATPLDNPGGLAVDALGDLFIAETGANRIRMVGSDGLVRTVAGAANRPGYIIDYTYALQSQLTAPTCLAMGNSGGLLICDSGDERIRELLPAVPGRWVLPLSGSAIGPNAWVSILGNFTCVPTMDWSDWIRATGTLPTSLAGVSVSVDGQPSVISYISSTRIDVLLSPILGPGWRTAAVTWPGGSFSTQILIAFNAAQFLSQEFNGVLYALATAPDGSVITPQQPALPGELVTFYVTGLNITMTIVPPYDTTLPGSMQLILDSVGYPVLTAGSGSTGVSGVVMQLPTNLTPGEYRLNLFSGGFISQFPAFLPIGANR